MSLHMGKIKVRRDWEKSELAQLIELYNFFLNCQLSGQKFVKTECYRPLAEKLNRTVASIEQKLMNISGVLKLHGRVDLIVKGYLPTDGFKLDMIDAVKIAIINPRAQVA